MQTSIQDKNVTLPSNSAALSDLNLQHNQSLDRQPGESPDDLRKRVAEMQEMALKLLAMSQSIMPLTNSTHDHASTPKQNSPEFRRNHIFPNSPEWRRAERHGENEFSFQIQHQSQHSMNSMASNQSQDSPSMTPEIILEVSQESICAEDAEGPESSISNGAAGETMQYKQLIQSSKKGTESSSSPRLGLNALNTSSSGNDSKSHALTMRNANRRITNNDSFSLSKQFKDTLSNRNADQDSHRPLEDLKLEDDQSISFGPTSLRTITQQAHSESGDDSSTFFHRNEPGDKKVTELHSLNDLLKVLGVGTDSNFRLGRKTYKLSFLNAQESVGTQTDPLLPVVLPNLQKHLSFKISEAGEDTKEVEEVELLVPSMDKQFSDLVKQQSEIQVKLPTTRDSKQSINNNNDDLSFTKSVARHQSAKDLSDKINFDKTSEELKEQSSKTSSKRKSSGSTKCAGNLGIAKPTSKQLIVQENDTKLLQMEEPLILKLPHSSSENTPRNREPTRKVSGKSTGSNDFFEQLQKQVAAELSNLNIKTKKASKIKKKKSSSIMERNAQLLQKAGSIAEIKPSKVKIEINQVDSIMSKIPDKNNTPPRVSNDHYIQNMMSPSQTSDFESFNTTPNHSDQIQKHKSPTKNAELNRFLSEPFTRILAPIKEDERENEKLELVSQTEDELNDFADDKSCISKINMLPQFQPDQSTKASRPAYSKDPLINFIYNFASSLKVDADEIVVEQQQQLPPRNDSTIEFGMENSDDFTLISSQAKTQAIDKQEYEINEIRNSIRQFGQLKKSWSEQVSPLSPTKKILTHRLPPSSKLPGFETGSSANNRPNVTPQNKISGKINQLEMTKTQSLLHNNKLKYFDNKNGIVSHTAFDTDSVQSPFEGRTQDRAPVAQPQLTEELKLKVQMNIISLALRKNQQQLKKLEQDLTAHINQQTNIINKHEQKVKEFMHNLERQKMQLHFAFLFACPLVLSYGKIDQEKYKLIPKLDYEREYSKIKQRLEVSQCQITITKRQCTTESFKEVLIRRPLGIHFSGHGILNSYETVGDYHELTKDQGDFLLFETVEGDSQLVSRTQLRNLLVTTKANLDFVFVASCHSEFVGRIFLEAGAKHVICIDHKQQVDDNAVITFTEAFYDAIFSNAMDVCRAFLNAKVMVSITHNKDESNMFRLLIRENYLEEVAQRKQSASRRSMFGSKKMNFTFADLDNSAESNTRLKSPPKRRDSSLHQVARDVRTKHVCVVFKGFPKGKFKEVITDEPFLQIGSIDQPVFVARQKDMFKLIQKILSPKSNRLLTLLGLPGIGKSSLARKTIQHINERNLLPGGYILLNTSGIKDCEVFLRTFNNKVVTQENPMFYDIFSAQEQGRTMQQDSFSITNLILDKIAALQKKVLLVIDNAEDLITFDKSNFKQLIKLLLTHVPTMTILLTTRCRLKLQTDINEEIILIYGLHPLQSMTLFQQITRPLSQKEITNLLNTRPNLKKYPSEKRYALPKKLHDHHLFRMIGGNPSMIMFLAPMLADTERPMDLVKMYNMLCADQKTGTELELEGDDQMMSVLRQSVNVSLQSMQDSDPQYLELLYLMALLPGGVHPKDLDMLWKAYKETYTVAGQCLRDLNQSIAPSFVSAIEGEDHDFQSDCKWKRAFLKLRKLRLISERKVSAELNSGQTKSNWMEDTLLSLPQFVTNFVEAQIPQAMLERFTNILSDYFKKEFAKLYEKNQNINFATGDNMSLNSQVSARINKLESNFWAFIGRKVDVVTESQIMNGQGEDGSEVESEKSEELAQSDDNEDGKVLQPKKFIKIKLINSSMSSNASKNSQGHNFGEQLQNQLMRETVKIQTMKQYDVLQNTDEHQVDLSHLSSRDRAILRWRNAYEMVKMKNNRNKLKNVKLFSGQAMEETSSDCENSPTNKQSSPVAGRGEWLKSLSQLGSRKNLLKIPQRNKPVEDAKVERTGSLGKKDMLAMKIEQKTKQFLRQQTSQIIANRQFTNASRGNNRISMDYEMATAMQDDELAIVYYIANIMLLEQYSLADSIIEKNLVRMPKCSPIFNGNIRRMQGICKLQLLRIRSKQWKFNNLQKDAINEMEDKIATIRQCFTKATSYFSMDKKKNLWGLALTSLNQAELIFFQEVVNSKMFEKKKPVATNASIQLQSLNQMKAWSSHRNLFGNKNKLSINTDTKSSGDGGLKPFNSKALKKLKEAKEAFDQLNHYRGSALTIQLMSEVSQFNPNKLDTQTSVDDLSLAFAANKEMDPVLETEYKKLLKLFREQQRSLLPGDLRAELCISRLKGETVSLNVEIVRGSPGSKGIFERKQMLVFGGEAQNESESSVLRTEFNDESHFQDKSRSYSLIKHDANVISVAQFPASPLLEINEADECNSLSKPKQKSISNASSPLKHTKTRPEIQLDSSSDEEIRTQKFNNFMTLKSPHSSIAIAMFPRQPAFTEPDDDDRGSCKTPPKSSETRVVPFFNRTRINSRETFQSLNFQKSPRYSEQIMTSPDANNKK